MAYLGLSGIDVSRMTFRFLFATNGIVLFATWCAMKLKPILIIDGIKDENNIGFVE